MQSLSIQLSDDVYAALAAVARTHGRSVEAVAADQLEAEFRTMPADTFWTRELLASLDDAAAEAESGGGITLDEMRSELAGRSQAWRTSRSA